MPGPVRYSKSGKVKKSAPRKYESGKGWSKLTPTKQAAPAASKARKGEVRRAVSRGDFGRQFARSPRTAEKRESGSEPIRPSLLPRKEIAAAVVDALTKPVDLPGKRFDNLGEMLAILTPGGVVKGASIGRAARFRAQKNPRWKRYTVANEQAGALGRAIRGRKGESIGKPWGPKRFDKAQAKANRAVRNRKKAQRKAALRNNIRRGGKRRVWDPNNVMTQRKVN